MGWWRTAWDWSFSLSSLLCSLLIGVVIGNIALGVPLDANHDYAGTFLDLLNPYALLVGVTTVALFMMHGCIYVIMKSEGELNRRARGWVYNTIIFFIMCYFLTTVSTLLYAPRMGIPFKEHPWLGILAIANMLAVANIPREIFHGREFRAFLSSSASVVLLMAVFGAGMFPDLVASHDPANSLNLYNAASSQTTLAIMLVIALLGVPLVLTYTVCIYWVFRGKVKLDAHSY